MPRGPVRPGGGIHFHGARYRDARCHRVATCVAPRRVSVTTSPRDEQPELDSDAGKSNALPARLRARRNVVIPRQVPPLHPSPIVHDRQRGVGGVGLEADACRAGVERVGDNFGEDRLLERAGVGVAEIFEEVLEVDAGFAHGAFLRRAHREAG